MVQFELKLEENVILKWKDFYLNYEKLKRVLKELKNDKDASKQTKKTKKKAKATKISEYKPSASEREGLIPDEPTKQGWLNFGSTAESDVVLEDFLDMQNYAELREIDRPSSTFECALCFEVIKFSRFYEETVEGLQDEFDIYAHDMTSKSSGGNSSNSSSYASQRDSKRNQSAAENRYHQQNSPASSSSSSSSPSVGDHLPSPAFFASSQQSSSTNLPPSPSSGLPPPPLPSFSSNEMPSFNLRSGYDAENPYSHNNNDHLNLQPLDPVIGGAQNPRSKSGSARSRRRSSVSKLNSFRNRRASYDEDLTDDEEELLSRYLDDDLKQEMKKRNAERRSRHSRRRALSLLYREMLELKNFAGLNYTAVIKIVKKANKTLKLHKGGKSADTAASLSLGKSPHAPDYQPVSEVFEVEHTYSNRSFREGSFADSEDSDNTSVDANSQRDLFELALVWMSYSNFNQGAEVQKLIHELEKLYSVLFCDGDIQLACGELESQSHSDKGAYSYEMLKLGFRLGMAMSFGIWMLWDCVIQGMRVGELGIGSTPAFPVLSALGGLLSLHWSWGIQVWVWTRFRVNYEYVFEFDPRYTRSYFTIFKDCAIDTVVYFTCVLFYLKSIVGRMPIPLHKLGLQPGVFAILALVYACHRLIFPWQERQGIWTTLYYLVFPWMGESVTFFQTYVGDVLTSMVKCLLNINYTVYFLASGDIWRSPKSFYVHESPWKDSFFYVSILGPAVVFFPLWFRFIQCLVRYKETGKRWPHQPNALKYGLMMVVTVFSALHPLYTTYSDTFAFQVFWISLFIISTLYATYWDICQDWGLGQKEYGFLSDRQMFPGRRYYYGAMIADLCLRSVWVYTLVPPSAQSSSVPSVMKGANWFAPIAMFLEMIRRTIWGVFRLENEQLRNTEGFRRVKFVPLHFDTAVQKLETTGESVVLEVVGFGSFIVIVGAWIVLVSSNRYNQHVELLTDDGSAVLE